MGWDSASNWTKKSDVVADTLRGLERNGYMVLAHASTSQGFYAAIEQADGKRHLFCAMIKKERGDFMRKDMSEASGPAMNDCPLKLLALVPCPGGHAIAFRDGVRAFHASKTRDLMGKTISLGTERRYLVDGKNGRSYLVTRDDGQRFKLTQQQVSYCQIVDVDVKAAIFSAARMG